MKTYVSGLLLLSLLPTSSATAQTIPDPALLAEINSIRAVDNHAHPLRFVTEGETDTEEAFSGPAQPMDAPVRLRPDNPEYVAAWRSLYGYEYDDMSEPHLRELAGVKRRVRRERGEAYPAWVLDRLGIEVMLANRVAMGRASRGAASSFLPGVTSKSPRQQRAL